MMRHNFYKALVLCLFSMIGTIAFAYDCEVDGIYYNLNKTNQTAKVTYKSTAYNSYSGVLSIPEEIAYDDVVYAVTSIGSRAFSGCIELTELTIPNTVNSIENFVFSGCNSLTKITFSDGISKLVFSTSNDLNTCPIEKVYFGRETSNGYAGSYYSPFSNMTSIKSVVFGKNINTVFGFSGCSSLTEVSIPNNVTSINSGAFEYCSSLAEITIPSSVTTVGEHSFDGCTSLAEVTILDGTETLSFPSYKVDHSFFAGCPIEKLYLGRNVTYSRTSNTFGSDIYHSPFSGIESLKTLIIGNSVTDIYYSAFFGCSGLTDLTMGNSLISISSAAFQGCTSLPQVVISNSVTSVGGNAFAECTALAELTIGNGVTSIGGRAFSGCCLTELIIPNNVTFIGGGAFQNCSSLTDVIISDGTTELEFNTYEYTGNYPTFKNCPINKLYLGRNFSYSYSTGGGRTYYSPFKDITSMTDLVLGDNFTSIGAETFSGCSGLTELTIPNAVTTIGSSAFLDCRGLTSVAIGSNITSIGASAFKNCINLLSITSLSTTPPEIASSTFDETTEQNATLHVLPDCQPFYMQALYWKNFFNIQEDVTDGISSINADKQYKNMIYTINGVKCNTTNLSDLPSGIYIVNGKKYIVK